MTSKKFLELCVSVVMDYVNNRLDKTDCVMIRESDIYVVWSCKTLQNNKALLSTSLHDGMYYELTYNGVKNELYLDAYKKWENVCIKVEEA